MLEGRRGEKVELGREGGSWAVGQGFILEARGGTWVRWGPSCLQVTRKPARRTLGSSWTYVDGTWAEG